MSRQRLDILGFVAVLTEAAAVSGVAIVLCKRLSTGKTLDAGAVLLSIGFAVLTCFTFYPIMKGYGLGQIQTWIDAWFALACLCFVLGRQAAAGAFIGLICMMKPQFALYLLWGLLRRRWTFALGFGAVTTLWLTASIAAFGLANHLDYISVLKFLSQHGEVYYPNQSINGLLQRLVGNGNSLEWQLHGFPPFNSIVYIGTEISAVLILGFALFRKSRSLITDKLDFATIAVAFTIVSPVAWEHHYGISPVVFVTLTFAVLAIENIASRNLLLICLGISYVLAANYFEFANKFAGTPLNVLQSYLLFAALLVLAIGQYLIRNERLLNCGRQTTAKRGADARRAPSELAAE